MTEYPVEALANAIAAACYRDLPDIEYMDRDWSAYRALKTAEERTRASTDPAFQVSKTRRPERRDISVCMFEQMWGSTALGYGGMGGAAMTNAYTVIVSCGRSACVYFGGGGRLAYTVDLGALSAAASDTWKRDIGGQCMPDVSEAERRYALSASNPASF